LARVAPWLAEAALVLALYAVWRLAGSLSVLHTAGALARGRDIWRFERLLHLPSEAWVQRSVLAHPPLVRALDTYYAVAHVPVLLAFLVWAFARHRDRYRPVRNVLALLTAGCLLIQLLPVAPPRLLHGIGVVDTGARFGPDVYGSSGLGNVDQLSAMPSVHVGWALLVGLGAVWLGRSRWRWLALLHAVLTCWVVVATGNHFWADGVAAAGLLGLAAAAQHRFGRRPAGATGRPAGAVLVLPGPAGPPGTGRPRAAQLPPVGRCE
jgi:hypothetical protein